MGGDLTRKDMLRKKSRNHYTNVTSTDPTAGDTCFPEVVPDAKVRVVWRIRFMNPVNDPVAVYVWQGDTVDTDRTAIDLVTVPAYAIVIMNEDIEQPEYTFKPNTSSTTTGNMMYINCGADSMDVKIDFYDEP